MGRNPNATRYFVRIHNETHEFKLQPDGLVRICIGIPQDCWDLCTASEMTLMEWIRIGVVREVPPAESQYAARADRDLPMLLRVGGDCGT